MKIDHLAIWAKDIEKLRVFYQTFFSAISSHKYINEKKGFSSYFLSFGRGARLEIMQMPSVKENENDPNIQFMGFAHFAISAGSIENVNSLTSLLVKEGYSVVDGPRKTGDGYYESVVLDPEQNRIEITV